MIFFIDQRIPTKCSTLEKIKDFCRSNFNNFCVDYILLIVSIDFIAAYFRTEDINSCHRLEKCKHRKFTFIQL